MSSIKQSSEHLVDVETLFTVVYMLVDDWFLEHPRKRVGRKAVFSDSEVVSLMLMIDFLPFASERQFLAYIRANHLALYPELLDQSQFNVGARTLRPWLEQLRQHWQSKLVEHLQAYVLLDSKPVPVLSYKRDKRHSDFLGSADYGVCTSRSMKYFGYKLVLITSLDGVPLCYDLVPANTDERRAAEEVLNMSQTAAS